MILYIRRCIVLLVVFQLCMVAGLLPAARASVIPTQTMIGANNDDQLRARLQTMISRDDVRAELLRRGVEPQMVEERLASLTPSELQVLQRHMDALPAGAGGGALAVIGVVFLILLILELVGVTNIFTKI